MALDFPANPVNGQIFGSYVWNASVGVWQGREESAAVAVMSPVAPASANPGDMWINTNDGTSFAYYNDGSSSQWIQILATGLPFYNNATLSGTLTASQIEATTKLIFEDSMTIALGDETSPITVGNGKVTFRAPFALTLTKIPRISLSNASTSGNPTIDIKKNGTTIFSTLLSIDANEKTSVTATTAAVLSTTAIADDDELRFDVTTAGTNAQGLKVTLYYKRA